MTGDEAGHSSLPGGDVTAVARRLWRTLLSAPAQRIAAQAALRKYSEGARAPEHDRHAKALAALSTARSNTIAQVDGASLAARSDAQARLDKQLAKVDASEKAALKAADLERLAQIEEIQVRTDERTWTADTMYEAREPRPKAELDELRKVTAQELEVTLARIEQVEQVLARAHLSLGDAPDPGGLELPCPPLSEQAELAQAVESRLRSSTPLRLMRLPLVQLLLVVACAGSGCAVGWIRGAGEVQALLQGAGWGVGAGLVVAITAWNVSGKRLRAMAGQLTGARELAERASKRIIEMGERRCEGMAASFKRSYQQERAEVQKSAAPMRKEVEESYARKLKAVDAGATKHRKAAMEQLKQSIDDAERARSESHEQANGHYARSVESENLTHAANLGGIAATEAAMLADLTGAWKAAQAQIASDSEHLEAIEREHCRPWGDPYWTSFRGRAAPSAVAKFGSVELRLGEIEGAMPQEPQLAWAAGAPASFRLPIALTLPSCASLLIECGHEGRQQAIALLQEAMLRILVALPPGSARFTVADPVGLGESFATFMHLADEAEHLIGERIWTDPRHIESRMTDLCEHMETVIQKYLRNEFRTIDEYNQRAGEIAEPYRFLVLCDFPANISDTAAQRLASIISSGPRCGVFTLIMRDLRAPMPGALSLEELQEGALRVLWRDGALRLAGQPFENNPLTLNPPPDTASAIALLQRISITARESKRVEVPFAAIAPDEEGLWRESAAQQLRVSLGRSGATRLQYLTLGTGTSQHALIAGKTGSGKSTLLHAMITNIALRFSPDEAELWLIDFKKGVEFRTYATNALPHARAVAVESDREFGLSVLRGLDAQMRKRGELFRALGVQDLQGYRRAQPGDALPRTVLIIDEFQELFTEDDRVSEESALLLDRLVRQGRAFGMHVVLGSQTLGGAYSIARATMGQMAVRIALQCNEADSQLILSDDNLAGRLLSRPGDAIYNDSGGLVEGNNPFQVVWLSDEERDRLLARVRKLERERPQRIKPRMIVFEGNAPADLETNMPLDAALRARAAGQRPSTPLLWFGDAISIKDPTAVGLRRQSGTNIMVIGQQEESSAALAAAAVVSLAAQFAPGECSLMLLDGTPSDDPQAGALARLQARLGLQGPSGGLRDVQQVLAEAAAELERRTSSPSANFTPCLVLIHEIHRFRSLRRNEDDFSFSSGTDAAPTPDKQLALLLREGPVVGIHVLVTCDSATNLARACDRNAIREFEWRILFQVSASDSSTLIDSPVASRLGAKRALLHSEESGTQEKFRPYSWPDTGWIDRSFAHAP